MITMNSNGLPTSRALSHARRIAALCRRSDILFSLSISLHDLGERYDKIVGVKNAHLQVEDTLRGLREIQRQTRFYLGINCVLTPLNFDRGEGLRRWGQEERIPVNFTLGEVRRGSATPRCAATFWYPAKRKKSSSGSSGLWPEGTPGKPSRAAVQRAGRPPRRAESAEALLSLRHGRRHPRLRRVPLLLQGQPVSRELPGRTTFSPVLRSGEPPLPPGRADPQKMPGLPPQHIQQDGARKRCPEVSPFFDPELRFRSGSSPSNSEARARGRPPRRRS